MKLKATTKVQYNLRAFSTTLPAIIANAMDIEKGDQLLWTLESQGNESVLTIELNKMDE